VYLLCLNPVTQTLVDNEPNLTETHSGQQYLWFEDSYADCIWIFTSWNYCPEVLGC